MLTITADVYSGRPNPSWVISDESEIAAALRNVVDTREAAAASTADALGGLGALRGFHIDLGSDELASDQGLPSTLFVPSAAAGDHGPLRALEDRLIRLATPAALSAGNAQQALSGADAIDIDGLQALLEQTRSGSSRQTVSDHRPGAAPPAGAGPEVAGEGSGEQEREGDPAAASEAVAVTCQIELGAYNPGFWNNDPSVRQRNNCYNYASNKRTNTFAQPGRGSGQIYTAITCAAVSVAALRDGLHRRFNCFAASEKPRYLVALVVAPGPGFRDFHWYRKNKEGFWSHKPGSTAARNVDNSGKVITNPETCNRGPYTQFCGYFYTCRSQRIN